MLFKGPSDVAVEEVHAILRHIVARTLESEECKGLAQYGQLKREIATCAAAALEAMKEDARKMVLTMVRLPCAVISPQQKRACSLHVCWAASFLYCWCICCRWKWSARISPLRSSGRSCSRMVAPMRMERLFVRFLDGRYSGFPAFGDDAAQL